MSSLSTGGGSSAVAASAHAGCARFRHTDPLIIGRSRRKLAAHLGKPDISAGIPEARWMRAMTFEALVRHERFVSPLLTTAVGRLGLDRPAAVRRDNGRVSVTATAAVLRRAHDSAIADGHATLITNLAIPFVGLEDDDATPVKPDFAIVAPRPAPNGGVTGSWLIMGDAKDYERVRSRIDDQRMLKGFLQVALGAESAAAWSQLPAGMEVHRSGALAVPRNAFLQPTAVIEQLDDHRQEVRARVAERTALLAQLGTTPVPGDGLADFVAHLESRFDPASCVSCALFNYCRAELRERVDHEDPAALLVEIGIEPEVRPALVGLIDGTGATDQAPASIVANVTATLRGLPQWTRQLRVDPAGLPGTINVVVAKSDAAALGVYGLGLSRVKSDGSATAWTFHAFADPQSPETRRRVMALLGAELDAAMSGLAARRPAEPEPVHLVLPDAVTGDLLVSISDSLAGVETSRLRWQRDLDMGRPALTWDGEEAVLPAPLTAHERLAISFLLEEDRARAMSLRWPIVNLRTMIARHLVAGGPAVDHGRLDYLVEWAEATESLGHRLVSDAIAENPHTPGARLSNARSDAIHQVAPRYGTSPHPGDPHVYRGLILDELSYKAAIVDRALRVLAGLGDSALRPLYRELEAAAQGVWRRRLRLHASDLVTFGRTQWFWRNNQVPMLDKDRACADQLLALGNPQAAADMARDAGNRELAVAVVTSIAPLRLLVRSRRLGDGRCVVALHINGQPCVEGGGVKVKIQQTSFKFDQMLGGVLAADDDTRRGLGLRWDVSEPVTLAVRDQVIVASHAWLGDLSKHEQIKVDRPGLDGISAPKPTCTENSYTDDPDAHQWCCRPHEIAEAATSDYFAEQRKLGKMNPEVWPPVIDAESLDVTAVGAPTDTGALDVDVSDRAEHLTTDDLD